MANLNLTQEKLEALRSEYKYRNARGKYPRQKMLKEYTSIYPWVLPDEVDPYFAFCTICECRLCAKRSDLGKHEGSIKHKENAAKKALEGTMGMLKGTAGWGEQEMQQTGMETSASTSASVSQDDDAEGDGKCMGEEAEPMEMVGNDDDGLYIKQEPVIDLVENSNADIDLGQLSPNSDEEGEEEDDDEDDDDDDDEDYVPLGNAYEPPAKRRSTEARRVSETLNLPAHITVSDVTNLQRFSIREIPSTAVSTYPKSTVTQSGQLPQLHYTPAAPLASITNTQPNLMITIKKVTTPMTSTVAAATQNANTTAASFPLTSLPAIPASITIAQQPKLAASTAPVAAVTATPQPQTSMAASSLAQTAQAIHSKATATAGVAPTLTMPAQPTLIRDSMVLFFDSICVSVKALPPKLATEAKIRVMELVGELEMRAIAEHEQSGMTSTNSAKGQQSAMVTSTTK